MDLITDNMESLTYMGLRFLPKSHVAERLVEELMEQLSISAEGVRVRADRRFREAVGALLGDLMRAAQMTPPRYAFRSMAAGSFTDAPVGYQTFKRALDASTRTGLVEHVRGCKGAGLEAQAARMRATPKLLALAKGYGVSPSDWSLHFKSGPRPASIYRPIVLKSSSRMKLRKKVPGEPMRIDPADRTAEALAKQVNELNAFFATVQIDPAESHYAFQRVFNQGDGPAFDWNKGGRLISMGASYQQMPRLDRQKMKLNGEAVAEIDIRASHLTILHALLKAPFSPHTADPYEVPGIPRDVVKRWVTMTLGHDRFQRCWSEANKKDYLEEHERDLQKDYPIATVREKVLTALPTLRTWPECKVRWGDLQYLESCAVLNAVHELATKRGIPAFPVHDSIIVPVSAASVATNVLTLSFEEVIGVQPALTCK